METEAQPCACVQLLAFSCDTIRVQAASVQLSTAPIGLNQRPYTGPESSTTKLSDIDSDNEAHIQNKQNLEFQRIQHKSAESDLKLLMESK